MRYFKGTTEFYSEVPTAVTLGKFDSLHRGHQKLIGRILEQKEKGLAAAVFIIAPEGGERLLSSEEKRSMLEEMGVDLVVECPFIPEILSMEPSEFITEVLVKKFRAEFVAVGTDFRFGHNRGGDAQYLRQEGTRCGFEVEIVEKERLEGREISSTYVREAIRTGDMELVSGLLGYHYSVSGIVQYGRQLGRKIGMPTVNIIPPEHKILPPNGVYFSLVTAEGQLYKGTANIGCKPTVDGSFIGVETFLHDYSGDLYGKPVKVELLKYRRPERKFGSIIELKACMEQDIRAGEAYHNGR